ncbi:MAG: enoyl-CoA hydratase-related protein, partial [Bacteriovoracaceae bacterium]
METKYISLEIKDNIAYVGFGLNNEKSMTTLDEPTLKEAKELVDNLKGKVKSKEVQGVIFFSHIDSCFIAGADINLISTLKTESDGAFGAEQGQIIYNEIEDLSVPTVACVHGPCLGGGMELALSCKKIICSNDKKTILGLPEVKLGLIPGFGGTYRMPKRVGLPNALDLILAGKTINSRKAKKIGLVDGVYPKERLISMGEKWLNKNKRKATFKESVAGLATDNFITRKIIFQKARESVLKLTKGFYQAPLKILDTMEAGASKGRSSYLTSEAQAFGELCVSEQSKNLQHIFFLMEGAKKYNGPKSDKKVNAPARGAVLGAGTMGGGIAWLMSNINMYPILKDINDDALELGLKQSSAIYRNGVKKRKLSFEDFEQKQRSITPTKSYAGFK